MVAALEHQLAQQIASHSVDSVELTFLPAEGTGVGVVLEPMVLAVTAQWLLALLALYGIFQHIVTYSTN